MDFERRSHANCCLLNCLSHADPADVLKDEKQFLYTLREFLRRCTQEQLVLLHGVNSNDACSANEGRTDAVGASANNEAAETAVTKQTASSNMAFRISTPKRHKNFGVSRDPSTVSISASQKSTSPQLSPSLEAHSSSHGNGGIDRELGTLSNAASGSTKMFQSNDADHIVIRAYKAIVNVMNLRWSVTGLPSQASLLAISERDHLGNPGARLFALRLKLRNEQHMAVAIDRIAAVLLVDMRDDLGGSYDGVREKGFRTAIVGNKMLADQWKKSRKEVVEEIRAAITYNFAEQIISPGINLLLGSRSQDVWEKRFSRKKVEFLHKLLKQTEEGRIVLSRAKSLDDAVITIKRILSIHVGYHWRCARYVPLNTQDSIDELFKKLQGQLSTRVTDMRQLESTLYSTLDKSTTQSGQATETPGEGSNSLTQVSVPTSGNSPTDKRKLSKLSDHDYPSKKRRCSLNASELQLDTRPTSDTSHIIDGLPLACKLVTNQGQDDREALSTNGMNESVNFSSQSSPEDHEMLDGEEKDNARSDLLNIEMGRKGDEMEHQTQPVSECQDPGNSLSYKYGEQWGIAEDVTTLDDILSLSW